MRNLAERVAVEIHASGCAGKLYRLCREPRRRSNRLSPPRPRGTRRSWVAVDCRRRGVLYARSRRRCGQGRSRPPGCTARRLRAFAAPTSRTLPHCLSPTIRDPLPQRPDDKKVQARQVENRPEEALVDHPPLLVRVWEARRDRLRRPAPVHARLHAANDRRAPRHGCPHRAVGRDSCASSRGRRSLLVDDGDPTKVH